MPTHCVEALYKTSYPHVLAARSHVCCMLATSGSSKVGNIMSYTICMGRHSVYTKEAGDED